MKEYESRKEAGEKVKQADCAVDYRKIAKTDVVFRIMMYDHIPEEKGRKKNPKTIADTKTKLYHTDKRFWPILVNKNPHKRVNNSNYTIIKNNEVKVEFANSLKILVEKKLSEGLKEDQIYEYLKEKYGEWILYEPALNVMHPETNI